jgi:hypothetical protein
MSTVATESTVQSSAIRRTKKIRDLMGGTAAMRAAGKTYLPQFTNEPKDAYDARLERSVLFGATSKTVADMTGKVFSKPITLADDVPTALKKYAENIDLAGRHLNVFARDVFADCMQPGISFILVDMPPALQNENGAPVTQEQEKRAGQRPYMVHIPVERVLGWKSTLANGVEYLTQFRIKECVTEPDGEWGEKDVEQVRVVEPGKWTTFRKNLENGDWVQHDEGNISLSYIPVAPVYINRIGYMRGRAPLDDLADLNIRHWQSSSDQANILTVARVPILFAAGFGENDTITIGASTALRSSDANARLNYVEHSGHAISAGQDEIKSLELQMQTLGLQLLVPQPGGKTATGEVHDSVKENSPLAMMASALQDALEQAFGFMADFIGLGPDAGGSIQVNKDFGGAAVGDAATLIAAVGAEVISKETFWHEMQRRGILSDSFDPAVEKDRLASAPPVL